MSAFLHTLQQPEYVHVLINHLPLTGLFVACLCLAGCLVIRKRAAVLLSMGLAGAFALSAWPVAEYGEEGYDRVYSMADKDGDAYLSLHKDLAARWVWLFYVTAAAGAVGLVAGWKWPKSLWACAAVTLILAIASLAAGAFIAEAGGKVRHPEFRNGPPPPTPAQGTQRFDPKATTDSRRAEIPILPGISIHDDVRPTAGAYLYI